MNARSLICGALLLLAGGAVYSNALKIPLVNDDVDAIVTNQTIRRLSDLSEVLSPPPDTTVAGRPVANLTFAIDLALFRGRLEGFHLTNIAIHLLAALILFALARRLLRRPASMGLSEPAADGVAAAIALLWVTHPLNVVAVSYVVQRVESLMGLLALATLYASVRALDGVRRRAWLWLALLTCGLGMGTKEVMVGVPLLVVLMDRAFFFGSWREAWLQRRALYLGLASTWGVLLLLVASHPRDLSAGAHASSLTSFSYFRMQCIIVAAYLVMVFHPVQLVFDYGDALTSIPVPTRISEWGPGLLVLTALGALATFAWWRGRRDVGFLGAWFFVLLAPSSSFVPIVTEPAAEHRLYLPMLAPIALVVCGGWALFMRTRVAAAGFACLVAATAGMLGRLTLLRNEAYATPITLWEDSIAQWPSSSRVYTHLGQLVEAKKDHRRAERLFARAVALDDNEVWAHYHLAQELDRRGAWGEALSHYKTCLHRISTPGLVEFHLANDLVELHHFDEALALYDRAVDQDPTHIEYASRRAAASARAGHPLPAEHARILALAPDFPGAFLDAAEMHLATGDRLAAMEDLHQAIKLDPTNEESWRKIGVLESCGAPTDRTRAEVARRALQTATLLDPQDQRAQGALTALAASGTTNDSGVCEGGTRLLTFWN